MIHRCTCDDLFCSTCDIPNDACAKCKKPLCPDCFLAAQYQHRGKCPTCASPPRLDDADLYYDPRPIWERRLDG